MAALYMNKCIVGAVLLPAVLLLPQGCGGNQKCLDGKNATNKCPPTKIDNPNTRTKCKGTCKLEDYTTGQCCVPAQGNSRGGNAGTNAPAIITTPQQVADPVTCKLWFGGGTGNKKIKCPPAASFLQGDVECRGSEGCTVEKCCTEFPKCSDKHATKCDGKLKNLILSKERFCKTKDCNKKADTAHCCMKQAEYFACTHVHDEGHCAECGKDKYGIRMRPHPTLDLCQYVCLMPYITAEEIIKDYKEGIEDSQEDLERDNKPAEKRRRLIVPMVAGVAAEIATPVLAEGAKAGVEALTDMIKGKQCTQCLPGFAVQDADCVEVRPDIIQVLIKRYANLPKSSLTDKIKDKAQDAAETLKDALGVGESDS